MRNQSAARIHHRNIAGNAEFRGFFLARRDQIASFSEGERLDLARHGWLRGWEPMKLLRLRGIC